MCNNRLFCRLKTRVKAIGIKSFVNIVNYRFIVSSSLAYRVIKHLHDCVLALLVNYQEIRSFILSYFAISFFYFIFFYIVLLMCYKKPPFGGSVGFYEPIKFVWSCKFPNFKGSHTPIGHTDILKLSLFVSKYF